MSVLKFNQPHCLTALFLLILNILKCHSRIIHFGSCSFVVGEPCDSSEVKFYLHTRSNAEVPEYVEFYDDGSNNLTDSAYNIKLPTKVIIHGYNSDMYLDVLQKMKDAYLVSKKQNVWFVNYPRLVNGPCYLFAVHNIKYVGKCVAYFINSLQDLSTNDLDIHVIGFSLGGQVTNYVAQYLPYKLPRITGLDPALPLFYTRALSNRLDSSDAQFVDVMHTNAALQGQIFPCGHVDFYMNSGIFQPGCPTNDLLNCAHARAPEYFTESIITRKGFWGWRCKSFWEFIENKCKPREPLQLMGEFVDQSLIGVYSVRTNSTSPYALGPNLEQLEQIDEESMDPNYLKVNRNV